MNSVRRFIPGLVIIVIAAGVAWWSSHAESSVTHHVQEEVEKLIPRFQLNPSTLHSIVIDPVLEPILASSLQFVYAESILHNQKIVVVVRDGDDEEYGDGTATHIATIRVNDKPITGLRIICSSSTDTLHITGVWTP